MAIYEMRTYTLPGVHLVGSLPVWNVKPEEFLKQPVYDRNFPPCKFCKRWRNPSLH